MFLQDEKPPQHFQYQKRELGSEKLDTDKEKTGLIHSEESGIEEINDKIKENQNINIIFFL